MKGRRRGENKEANNLSVECHSFVVAKHLLHQGKSPSRDCLRHHDLGKPRQKMGVRISSKQTPPTERALPQSTRAGQRAQVPESQKEQTHTHTSDPRTRQFHCTQDQKHASWLGNTKNGYTAIHELAHTDSMQYMHHHTRMEHLKCMCMCVCVCVCMCMCEGMMPDLQGQQASQIGQGARPRVSGIAIAERLENCGHQGCQCTRQQGGSQDTARCRRDGHTIHPRDPGVLQDEVANAVCVASSGPIARAVISTHTQELFLSFQCQRVEVNSMDRHSGVYQQGDRIT